MIKKVLKYNVILYDMCQVLTHENLLKTSDWSTAQLAKMSADPKLVELTADVDRRKIFIKTLHLVNNRLPGTQ